MPAVGPRREFSISFPMKRPGLTPRLLAATLFLAAASRLAADEPKPAPPPAPAMRLDRADELLKRFDKNGDGKLDETELADAHEAMLKEQLDRQAIQATRPNADQFRAKMLEQFDRNHDGRLDDDERAEMRKYIEEHGLGETGEVREELMKRFDKNADGKLDDAERAEMMKFLQERRTQGGAQMRDFLLLSFDLNGDGKIDDAEMATLEKTMRPRMEQNPQQLRRFDLNGDGKIDDAEWAAARAQLVRLLNAPRPPAPVVVEQSATSPSPTDEQARLERVAAEVARRRAEREAAKQAQQAVAPKPGGN